MLLRTVILQKQVAGCLVNDKQTYEVLKRDPTPASQHKLNNTLLTLKKSTKIDNRRYNRLRCSVPQPPKLYGLPKTTQTQNTYAANNNGPIQATFTLLFKLDQLVRISRLAQTCWSEESHR